MRRSAALYASNIGRPTSKCEQPTALRRVRRAPPRALRLEEPTQLMFKLCRGGALVGRVGVTKDHEQVVTVAGVEPVAVDVQVRRVNVAAPWNVAAQHAPDRDRHHADAAGLRRCLLLAWWGPPSWRLARRVLLGE
eukprot:scaffold905_cov70-Phaeocystis_antarctica.AAC.1